MSEVKDLHYGEKGVETIEMRLVASEERNFLCYGCMKVFKDKLFMLVLDDETQAIQHIVNAPTPEKPYFCETCKKKKKE